MEECKYYLILQAYQIHRINNVDILYFWYYQLLQAHKYTDRKGFQLQNFWGPASVLMILLFYKHMNILTGKNLDAEFGGTASVLMIL